MQTLAPRGGEIVSILREPVLHGTHKCTTATPKGGRFAIPAVLARSHLLRRFFAIYSGRNLAGFQSIPQKSAEWMEHTGPVGNSELGECNKQHHKSDRHPHSKHR